MQLGDGVDKHQGSVLLVESDGLLRGEIGVWLENAGFEVMACPGPRAPAYRCVGGDGGRCPLVEAADLVVLDLWLASDSAFEGTCGIDLLRYYLSAGRPVVAITYRSDSTRTFAEAGLMEILWPADRAEVVETVRTAVHRSRRTPPLDLA